MTNPFEPPADAVGRGPLAPGTFSIRTSLSDAFHGLMGNLVAWLIGGVLALLVYFVGLLFCILPGLVAGWALTWGFTRFTLDCLDGEADWRVIFEPLSSFGRLGEVLPPMVGLAVVGFFIGLPVQVSVKLLDATLEGDGPGTGLLVLLGLLVLFVVSTVLSMRILMLAPYLVVDANLSLEQALRQSWALTRPVWGRMVLWLVALFGVLVLGVVACLVGVLPAYALTHLATASVYRQLTREA